MTIRWAAAGLVLALGACGGSGAGVPDQFAGTWGADCSSPFVKFDGGTVHVFPDNADYSIKSATLTGNDLKVAYDTKDRGTVTDTYESQGSTLRLTKTEAAGGEATWDKAPMSKCP